MVLVFNLAKPPLDDVDLRLAIAHAVDPEIINRAIFFGRALVADAGMWPTGAWAHDPSVPRPHYDPEKAREYLRKAGRPDGFEFTAVTYNNPTLIPASEVVRAMQDRGISRVPVIDANRVCGVVAESDVLTGLVAGSISPDDPVEKVMSARFAVVDPSEPLPSLLQVVRDSDIAVVMDADALAGVITKIDLIAFLTDSLS